MGRWPTLIVCSLVLIAFLAAVGTFLHPFTEGFGKWVVAHIGAWPTIIILVIALVVGNIWAYRANSN